MSSPEIVLATVVSSDFQENTYIAQIKGREDCLVIDPGLEPDAIVEHLTDKQLTPAAILNTHAHADHIAGNAELKRHWPDCPLVIGADEAAKLTDPVLNLSAGFGLRLVSPPADRTVRDGETFSAAGFNLRVLAVPGHSAGHVAYVWDEHVPPMAWVGDVIFAGGIGRFDFPDSDYRQLMSSIRDRLFVLPDATVLLSGHGPATTVIREKRNNPFVGENPFG